MSKRKKRFQKTKQPRPIYFELTYQPVRDISDLNRCPLICPSNPKVPEGKEI
jgi:hypothetical protein